MLTTPTIRIKFSGGRALAIGLSDMSVGQLVITGSGVASIIYPATFYALPVNGNTSNIPVPLSPSNTTLVSLGIRRPFAFCISARGNGGFKMFTAPLHVPTVAARFVSASESAALTTGFRADTPCRSVLIRLVRDVVHFSRLTLPPRNFVFAGVRRGRERPIPLSIVPGHLFSNSAFDNLVCRMGGGAAGSVALAGAQFCIHKLQTLSLSGGALTPGRSAHVCRVIDKRFLW